MRAWAKRHRFLLSRKMSLIAFGVDLVPVLPVRSDCVIPH